MPGTLPGTGIQWRARYAEAVDLAELPSSGDNVIWIKSSQAVTVKILFIRRYHKPYFLLIKKMQTEVIDV